MCVNNKCIYGVQNVKRFEKGKVIGRNINERVWQGIGSIDRKKIRINYL